MPQGQPLGYNQPQVGPSPLAAILSQALGGPAELDPAEAERMRLEMEMRKYDAMMKSQGVAKAFAPRGRAPVAASPQQQTAGFSLNPLAPLNQVLGQPAPR